jgi:hypothetical protein
LFNSISSKCSADLILVVIVPFLRYATAFGTTGNVKSKIILQVIENQYEYTNGAIFIQKGTIKK